ncbi:MAG: fused MFS/spermidine synthase, partial [Planctomycetota bacterium]|nr:fused MFS/spermidine synthase [Planctomycetota bacterium]
PCVMTAGLAIGATLHLRHDDLTVVHASRGFFGRLRVYERSGVSREGGRPVMRKTRTIAHGYTLHGLQFQGDRASLPTTYFTPRSGVGTAIRYLRAVVTPERQKNGERVRIGVIGLGAGTLAAYAFDCDDFRFYEIQPAVIDAAERDFTFLAAARERGANVETVLGDARIQLERELEGSGSHKFDLLVVDAFSSDAIPKHLLTKECVELYWKHLRADGLLAIHITNRFLDLLPVVRGLADASGKRLLYFTNIDELATATRRAMWVVLTSNEIFLSEKHGAQYATPSGSTKKPILWTDDFSSLWHVLR